MSIPKIIHFVWFSAEMPRNTKERIDHWKLLMPEYEFIHWNASNFDVPNNPWVREAVDHKMWAFATDYIRFWALQKYGGIYLDTDVQVLRPFDDLLDRPYFIGMEQTKSIIEAAVLGAEVGCEWVTQMFDYYTGRCFLNLERKPDVTPLPKIMTRNLGTNFGFLPISNPSQFNANLRQIQLLPFEYFSPKRWDSQIASVTKNTYCIHHFEGSWTMGGAGASNIRKKFRRDLLRFARAIVGDKRWQAVLYRIFTKGQHCPK